MKKVISFTASWCGPCKMIKPILQKLSEEEKIVWENKDIDENRDLVKELNITSVPTLIYMIDGKEYNRTTGYMPMEKIIYNYN
jgi:thioredoxin 1